MSWSLVEHVAPESRVLSEHVDEVSALAALELAAAGEPENVFHTVDHAGRAVWTTEAGPVERV